MTAPRALLLCGTVGSGKTTVMLALGEQLKARGDPYALVDLDWLCWVSPAPGSGLSVQDVLVANLRAVWPAYAEAGVTYVVLARHVRAAADVEEIRAAVGGELVVIVLDAPRGVLETRIRARDTDSDLDEHLAELAAESAPLALGTAVANDGGTPRETAREVLAAAGW